MSIVRDIYSLDYIFNRLRLDCIYLCNCSDRIYDIIRHILSLHPNNLIVAGGYALECYKGIKAADIDMFIYGDISDDVRNDIIIDILEVVLDNDRKAPLDIHVTNAALTIRFNYMGNKVLLQIILIRYATPIDIITSFDLYPCMIYIDGKCDIYTTHASYICIEKMLIPIDVTKRVNTNYPYRVIKYVKKKFNVIMCISNINSILNSIHRYDYIGEFSVKINKSPETTDKISAYIEAVVNVCKRGSYMSLCDISGVDIMTSLVGEYPIRLLRGNIDTTVRDNVFKRLIHKVIYNTISVRDIFSMFNTEDREKFFAYVNNNNKVLCIEMIEKVRSKFNIEFNNKYKQYDVKDYRYLRLIFQSARLNTKIHPSIYWCNFYNKITVGLSSAVYVCVCQVCDKYDICNELKDIILTFILIDDYYSTFDKLVTSSNIYNNNEHNINGYIVSDNF